MSEQRSAYQRFIELTHDFYRQSGCELPYFESDPSSAIAFEASVDDVTFSVGYDPAPAEGGIFVYCAFGLAPAEREAVVLRRLLELNLSEARRERGMYCLDSQTRQVAYFVTPHVHGTDAQWLRECMVSVAARATQWRRDYLLAGRCGSRQQERRFRPLDSVRMSPIPRAP